MSRPRILARHRADENHEVVSLSGGDFRYRSRPCAECPWRRDSPIGAFPAEAYRLSAHTAYDMSGSTFACHMAGKEKPATCAGYLLRGADHSFAIRMKAARGEYDPRRVSDSGIPLYGSYREMAEANGVLPDDPVLRGCR